MEWFLNKSLEFFTVVLLCFVFDSRPRIDSLYILMASYDKSSRWRFRCYFEKNIMCFSSDAGQPKKTASKNGRKMNG